MIFQGSPVGRVFVSVVAGLAAFAVASVLVSIFKPKTVIQYTVTSQVEQYCASWVVVDSYRVVRVNGGEEDIIIETQDLDEAIKVKSKLSGSLYPISNLDEELALQPHNKLDEASVNKDEQH